IVSRGAFLSGLAVQDSPLYGAERRGAPVVAFTRISDRPILERGYIDAPDVVVVMDASLLSLPEAAVLDGVDAATLLLVNTAAGLNGLAQRTAARLVGIDVSAIALAALSHNLLSAPMAGFVAKASGILPFGVLAEATRIELETIGVTGAQLAANLEATRRAYDAAPHVGLGARGASSGASRVAPTEFIVPRLPARLALPSVEAEANSTLRHTEGWRVFRPLIELAHCSRCFVCFALCPEGAIHLDERNYPVVDLEHCKGCLICAHECPTHTIREVREDAA
ncbi:MAG: 2-oxoacid:acceptor oxidoreductase family protein, partial [Deltaproteobacteria bacterium]|nr:2-oxoacid:acceptor oxidoreductase family protein [Deltaproteobacteria bacterium]